MSTSMRRSLAILIAVVFVLMEPLMMVTGYGTAYANVGSIAEGEDVKYDKNGGVLSALGFDTSVMPADYDPDATTNPYGSDVTTANEVKEGVWFDTSLKDSTDPRVVVYGHDKPLDADMNSFMKDPKSLDLTFLAKNAFVSAVKCDLNGDGRDSALAVVYTFYTYEMALLDPDKLDRKVYMCVFDPVSGKHTNSFEIATLAADKDNKERFLFDYMVQSQMVITAGDYDKDSVDEIAVYAPSENETSGNKIKFFDLVEGKDCQDPFDENSWRQSWNFVLPVSSEEVINCSLDPSAKKYAKNIYNSIDLKSGDADNDGICDLIASYGASDTDYCKRTEGVEMKVVRSIPSNSVLLYGSDQGQMLRDAQQISYGGESLIRVSFAFGDVDGDGNEDMFIAGQEQDEQDNNISREIGKYVYDSDSKQMSLESMQNLKVVNGQWENGEFTSSNGWDGAYYSTPLMKTNIAVGNIGGGENNTRIYLDSVLYSYDDGNYDIVDELEDDSETDSDDGKKKKGSCLFAGDNAMKGYYGSDDKQAAYYEYGADCGNYTGSVTDSVVTNRVSIMKDRSDGKNVEASTSILYMDKENKWQRTDPIADKEYSGGFIGSPILAVPADTDVDSLVAEYTGEHDITYQSPDVLAVLAAAPYFKDVAAYDGGEMLSECSTEYGSSEGSSHGHETTYSSHLGVFINSAWGSEECHGITNLTFGWAREETWGWEKEREFEMSYETAGGEDAVVLYSVPTENYIYKVHVVTVDDDGNCTPFDNTMTVAKPHNPVTQTLTLDDYMEIQRVNKEPMPDVTKYLTSTPGDPSTYPSDCDDISDEAKEHLDTDVDYWNDCGDKWSGVAFGEGSETQRLTYSKNTRDRYRNHMDGTFGSIEVGWGTEEAFLVFVSLETGASYEYEQVEGWTNASIEGSDCAGTVANMPRSAKGYGYDFEWKIFKYNILDGNNSFPVVTYMVNNVTMPPVLPDDIQQDFDNTTDSQVALTWTYSHGNPLGFDIYRYEDFPVGGGDKLVGTVGGSEYRILKDENGNTLKDKDGHVVRGYSFIDTDLTADTKYSYRMKVRTQKLPSESIFSPVIEGRTDVGTKPALSLSTDSLKIYPDSTYEIKVNLADPENYQKEISYQWQKYNSKTRKWEDIKGCDKQILMFYNCEAADEGSYRCRVNLIRKVESHPQYISAFTEACDVDFSLRDVKFGDINVTEIPDGSKKNTAVSVKVMNASESSLERPTGTVVFSIKGPNGTFQVIGNVDEASGIATVTSIEKRIGDLGTQSLVDGGYLVTAKYQGSAIFYPADDPEEYHYLRNIGECMFLSTMSSYYFGDDVAETAELLDYKIGEDGKVRMTDYTDKMTAIKIYKVASDGVSKDGDPVGTFDLTKKDAKARIPFNKKLTRMAYIEAYMEGSEKPAASGVVTTKKIQVEFDVKDKTTGTGDLLEFLTTDDLSIVGGVDVDETIETDDGDKKLSDFLLFKYYEQNSDFICDSKHTDDHKKDFIPASYYGTVEFIEDEDGDDVRWFFRPGFKGGRFMVVGNYYFVSAGPLDKSSGSVKMVSPDDYIDFEKKGYVGGTKIVLKAVPNKGYEISKWIVDDCGETNTIYPGTEKLTYTVRTQNTAGDGEVKITAEMTPKDNKLTYGKIGRGTVTVDPEIESGLTVLAETKLNFTATPDDGWTFDEWRWANDGGDSIVSGGVTAPDGSNTKTFTMPDNSASLYAVFSKNTIDVAIPGGVDVSYINDGSNPYYDDGVTVATEKGKGVPKGVKTIASCKPGYMLAPGAEWKVTVTTPQGITPVNVEQYLVDGRPACRFNLPDDVTGCAVQADTVKGRFSVYASAPDSGFTIKVDGQDVEMTDGAVNDIEGGSQVDITALPERGKKVASWIINGEEKESGDATYSVNITENLALSVDTDDEDKYALKLSTEGGGKGGYAITDQNGEVIEGTFQGDETSVDVYKGESVKISASPDDTSHTMTALFMDGVQQEVNAGEFNINSISDDVSIMCRFGTNKFHNMTFKKSGKLGNRTVYDMNDAEIKDGDVVKVPDEGTLEFYVKTSSDLLCTVLVDGKVLKGNNVGGYRFNYKIENIKTASTIEVTDHPVMTINTAEDLKNYFEVLFENPQPGDQPNAVLNADITMGEGDKLMSSPLFNYTSFDGQGHTITGLTYGSEDNRVSDFKGIFGSLSAVGEVKNVHFKDVKVYAARKADGCAGLLTYNNEGHITGVAITGDSVFDFDCGNHNEPVGALAYSNKGKIDNCIVKDLFIKSTAEAYQSGTTQQLNNVGTACVVQTEDPSQISCNYFENLTIKGSDMDDEKMSAKRNIVTIAERGNNESFEKNYFRQVYGAHAKDANGISVYSLTSNPDDEGVATSESTTPEFVRDLAGGMNTYLKDKAWGTEAADKGELFLTALEGGKYTAPAEVSFQANGKELTKYFYPGSNVLPGDAEFGEYTPIAWVIGDFAYIPGSTVEITKDMTVTGIQDVSEYTASLSSDDGKTAVYFMNIKDAAKEAEAHKIIGPQTLTINKGCTLGGVDFIADSTTTIDIKEHAVLTVKKDAQIITKGTFRMESGSVMHKYGSMLNEGIMTIESGASLYNYGSTLENKGTITGKERIICTPHVYEEWQNAEQPDEQGRWLRSSTCSVCGNEITEEIKPDPPASKVDKIIIQSEPERLTYEAGDKFSDKGLAVTALLIDGTKTSVKSYKLYYTVNGEQFELEDGFVLNEEGTYDVTAKYEGFSAGFTIAVLNTKDLLTVTDEKGNEPKELDMNSGDEIKLTASLKSSLPYKTSFSWESSDTSVVGFGEPGTGNEKTLIAGKPGSADITISVLDDKGNVVKSIDPVTIRINNVSHITDLKIVGDDVYLDKGESYEMKVDITPQDTTDKITWTSSDESVATVDKNGVITAVGGGTATVTVSVAEADAGSGEALSGLSDSRKVFVHEKAKDLTLEPDTLAMAAGEFDGITAIVQNGCANGDVTWTTSDASIAGFYVRNEETGEMEIVDKAVTKLSADGNDTSDAYIIVAGVKDGQAVVTAETEAEDGGMLTKECQVTVATSEKFVHITHNGARISGETMVLSLDGRFIQLAAESSEEDDTFTWSTLDDKSDPVLKVDSTGGVTLRRKGSACVKVTSNTTGEDDICFINVMIVPTGVLLSDTEVVLGRKEAYKLRAELLPEGAEGAVLWSSSDSTVATVDPDGTVKAVGPGTAEISAVPDVEGAKAEKCKVTVIDPKLDVTLSDNEFIYDGTNQIPAITVKNGDTVLGEDLTESNENVIILFSGVESKLPGIYKVTAIAREWQYGSGEATYEIKVKPTKLKSVKKPKKGRKKFTAKWAKVDKKNITGYQLRWSLKSNMKADKKKYIKKASIGKVTIKKNLKGGKRYYVQVRTYVQKNGIKYYSAWSNKKSVKTKK